MASSASAATTVVIDARPVVRLGLSRVAFEAFGRHHAFASPAEAAELAGVPVRLALVGIGLRGAAGAEIEEAKETLDAPIVAVLLAADAALLGPALQAGADGAVLLDLLDPAHLCSVAATIEAGEPAVPPELARWVGRRPGGSRITARCLEVLRGLAAGLHDDELAEQLGITSSSVRKQIRAAEQKLSAATRCEAVARAKRAGIL